MRLRGAAKKAATREQRRGRVVRCRLSKQAVDIASFTSFEAGDTERGRKIEPHEVIAWIAGWAPRPRIKLWAHMRLLWPQTDIYELVYGSSPMFGLIEGAQ